MAKYLRTSSIKAELENLIRDAKKELYIISPYLKLSDNMKELLNDKEREKVDVRIIFGKQELAPKKFKVLRKTYLSYLHKSAGDNMIELSSHGDMKVLKKHYIDAEVVAKGLTMRIFE